MAVGREEIEPGTARMIQGRVWVQRVPRREMAVEAAQERYEWWRRVYPNLFDPRRYAKGAAPENVGKGCVVCGMDTRETEVQRCPRCRRSLIWVSFESLAY